MATKIQLRLIVMKDIFSTAWRAVVWLGEGYNGYTAKAIDIIRKAAKYGCSEMGLTAEDLDLVTFRMLGVKPEPRFSENKEKRNLPPST
jgi:hypothetical protein